MNFRARLSLCALETRENPSGPSPIDPISTDPPSTEPVPTTPATTTTTTDIILDSSTSIVVGTTP